jgi:hypothetical protein
MNRLQKEIKSNLLLHFEFHNLRLKAIEDEFESQGNMADL